MVKSETIGSQTFVNKVQAADALKLYITQSSLSAETEGFLTCQIRCHGLNYKQA